MGSPPAPARSRSRPRRLRRWWAARWPPRSAPPRIQATPCATNCARAVRGSPQPKTLSKPGTAPWRGCSPSTTARSARPTSRRNRRGWTPWQPIPACSGTASKAKTPTWASCSSCCACCPMPSSTSTLARSRLRPDSRGEIHLQAESRGSTRRTTKPRR